MHSMDTRKAKLLSHHTMGQPLYEMSRKYRFTFSFERIMYVGVKFSRGIIIIIIIIISIRTQSTNTEKQLTQQYRL